MAASASLCIALSDLLRELLTSLKGIGANQVTGHRATGLGGRNRLFELEQAYESQRDYTELLPLSYEVCYGVLTRMTKTFSSQAQIQRLAGKQLDWSVACGEQTGIADGCL